MKLSYISHRLSRIFQPQNVAPKNAPTKNSDGLSKSQRLMMDLGIVRSSSPGCFTFLPLGIRSIEKLTRLIDEEMYQIGAQKVELPLLTNAGLWKITGRYSSMVDELFTVGDRYKRDYVLSPTHEEAVTDLLASVSPLSYRQFPLLLYQITNKFRDEVKPRFGLMRSRQFLMKDLYTFDVDMEAAKKTYDIVCKSYDNIFKKLSVDYVKVVGTTGDIGGLLSHEYHYPATVGEDRLLFCQSCGFSANVNYCEENKCPSCNEATNLKFQSGIEVGHTFLLGEKYTKSLKAKYVSSKDKTETLQMGCYGIGLSRLIAASLEVLSDTDRLKWPIRIVPYSVVIILPKAGSKEETQNADLLSGVCEVLTSHLVLMNDILLDDRTNTTIGKRLLEAKSMGYPYIIVLGKKTLEDPPLLELHDQILGKQMYLSKEQILHYVTEKLNTI